MGGDKTPPLTIQKFMASIKVLGSSSKGNCYLLDCDGEVLIIELGVDFSEVIKELDYGKRIKDVVG